jgi:hypothetical protein
MTIGPAPICIWCKRYLEGKDIGDSNTCDAFPEGIPDEIQVGGFDHRNQFKGDKGVRFDARPDIPMDWEPL